MSRKIRPEWGWLALVFGLLLLAVLGLGVVLMQKYGWAQSVLRDVAPRHAMLSGLAERGDQIKALQTELNANYAGFVATGEGEDARVGTEALQRVRDLASKHGLQVASSQVMPSRDEAGLQRIGLSLRVEGEYEKLVALLRDMADVRPRLYSESLQLNSANVVSVRRGRGAQPEQQVEVPRVNAQLSLFVLRAKP